MTNSELRDLYKHYYANTFKNDLNPKPWEKHYAFFPKYVNGEWVWLDYYYSRYVWTEYKADDGYHDHMWTKRFGTIFDVLKEG